MPGPHVYVFDAYGTLFDVHAAASAQRDKIGVGWEKLSQTWRSKHLEYTWIHAMTGRDASFWSLTQQSLDYAIATVGGVPEGVREKLLAAYRSMQTFPEVPAVLKQLKQRGAGIFKPDKAVYRLVLDRFGGAADDVSFQSSNRWDIAGAEVFGFRTVWVNRSGAPDEYPGMAADRIVPNLEALLVDA